MPCHVKILFGMIIELFFIFFFKEKRMRVEALTKKVDLTRTQTKMVTTISPIKSYQPSNFIIVAEYNKSWGVNYQDISGDDSWISQIT